MAVGDGNIGILYPVSGLKLGIASAGVKMPGRKDLVVMSIAQGSTVAGVFTKNLFCAAPVTIAKDHLARATPRYLLINTGNANAGTGPSGMVNGERCCAALAEIAGCETEAVLPFSTGVIGEPLPVDKIVNALPAAMENLDEGQWLAAAEGIMTTDSRPKACSVQVDLDGCLITITGISKGAGMICPNMATMLGFVATDAAIDTPTLQNLVRQASEHSFNRITVDGDTSTNDACMFVATGAAGNEPLLEGTAAYSKFEVALSKVFLSLAQAIVKDGEGATKFVEVRVSGARDEKDALKVAYAIAHSPLVKTALFASDPNWGRILAVVGRSGLESLDLNQVNIWLGSAQIVEDGGRASAYSEEQGQAVMNQEEILIHVDLGAGTAVESVWTTDLSHDYVRINAEYRT
ncbi:MAG: bifunctional glutamate N-acetyltransferase/amino-acid acetyltransferase ArgJ [Pseudomonadales bacterium]|nr:bifunctional glutamate N-acetyltransferase/amino-acid acetyltransferase ArgJ [Pseudomonadales bacterium]